MSRGVKVAVGLCGIDWGLCTAMLACSSPARWAVGETQGAERVNDPLTESAAGDSVVKTITSF